MPLFACQPERGRLDVSNRAAKPGDPSAGLNCRSSIPRNWNNTTRKPAVTTLARSPMSPTHFVRLETVTHWSGFTWNEDKPAAIALFERGLTLTLYGGSEFTMRIGARASRRSTTSDFEQSPQSKRCWPRIHRSPGC